MQTTPEIVEAMPGTLVGSREAIVDKLRANREQWAHFVRGHPRWRDRQHGAHRRRAGGHLTSENGEG